MKKRALKICTAVWIVNHKSHFSLHMYFQIWIEPCGKQSLIRPHEAYLHFTQEKEPQGLVKPVCIFSTRSLVPCGSLLKCEIAWNCVKLCGIALWLPLKEALASWGSLSPSLWEGATRQFHTISRNFTLGEGATRHKAARGKMQRGLMRPCGSRRVQMQKGLVSLMRPCDSGRAQRPCGPHEASLRLASSRVWVFS